MTVTTSYQIITPDGVTFNLDGTHYRVAGALDNVGMPPVRSYTHQVPGQPGAVLDDLLDDVRVVTVSLAAHDCDIEKVFQAMNDHMANFRYNRTLTLQPLRLRVTVNGTAADLYCYYGGMITSEIDNVHALYGFTLVAYDPYWYSTSETSAPLDVRNALTENYVIGQIDGEWNNLGGNGTGNVYCMAKDANGNLYVGGTFDNWAGIPEADRIVKYTVSTGTWSALGTTPINGDVTSIAIAANGDIYIGGGFVNAGGAGTADYLAALKNGAADWTTITAGGETNGIVRALCLTSNGYLWVGGAFDSIGGVAAECIAKYNIATGAWTAAAGFNNTTDTIWAIAEGQDGTIYAGGVFTDADGDADADNLAQWDGTNWTAVGGPLDAVVRTLAIGADGALYAAGSFTTWNGVATAYIGKWDGSVVSALGDGLLGAVYANLSFADNSSDLYVASGLKPYVWNGNTFSELPIALSANALAYAVCVIGDDLFLGLLTFIALGTAYVPGSAPVTYSGNVASPPTLAIEGPGTLYSVRNETTGVEISSDLYINPGETITIDLGAPGEIPAGKSVTTDWAARPNARNLLGQIAAPVQLTQFTLVPAPIAPSGVNLICAFMDRPTGYGELLSNTGFETAGGGGADVFANWAETAGDGAIASETTIVHSGGHSCKLTAGTTASASMAQAATVVPGKTYRFSAWIYGDGTNPGRYSVYDVTNAAHITGFTAIGTAGAAWERQVVYFTAPAGCVSVYITLSSPALNSGGVVYFDDTSLELVTATIAYYNRYDSLQAAVD
jgi:hypothetical protein